MKYIKVRTLSFGSLFKIMMMPASVHSIFSILLIMGIVFFSDLSLPEKSNQFIEGITVTVIGLIIGLSCLSTILYSASLAFWIKFGVWLWSKFGTLTFTYEGTDPGTIKFADPQGLPVETSLTGIKRYIKVKTLSFWTLVKLCNISSSFFVLLISFSLVRQDYDTIIKNVFGFIGVTLSLLLAIFIFSFLHAAMAKLGFWIYNKFSTEPMTITYYEALAATTSEKNSGETIAG